MTPTVVAYDFTIYEEDGETPLFGLVTTGEPESDFQTPSSDLDHPRPYLRVPAGWTGQQINPPHGSATTGAISVAVVDMPTDPADQETGLVTSRIKDTPGKRARLRRWDPDDEVWLPAWEGVVESYSVDPDELLVYWFHLRDGREFMRDRSLFFSNYVLLGELVTIEGKQIALDGPAIDYGLLPNGRIYFEEEGVQVRSNFLLNRVRPWESIAAGEITHFKRGEPITVFGQTVYWGLTPGINATVKVRQNRDPKWIAPRLEYYYSPFAFGLANRMFPVAADDGLFYFEDFWIRWRAKGSDDPWTELRVMPRATPNLAVHYPNQPIPNPNGVGQFIYSSAPTLYFGSFDEGDLPEDDQEIELQVMASRITPDTPFWWDGGTLGDLLQEIVAGDHTLEPPKERYDAAVLAAFALSAPRARFILTAPVTDRMRWMEEHIYKPALVVPALNDQLEIVPTSWLAPANDAEVPLLDPDTVEPVGEWEHGTGNAIGDVEYVYIRESLEPRGEGEADTKDERPDWMRVVEEEVVVQREHADHLPGASQVRFAPVTIRAIGSVDGRSLDAGDAYDFGPVELANRTIAEVFRLFGPGAPTYEARITSTPANLALRGGQLLRLRSEYLPDYGSARRGTRRYMLVLSVSEEGPSHRRILLLDTGVPDLTLEEGETPPPGTQDCLDGGTAFPTATGMIRRFITPGRHELVVTCPTTVKILGVAGGGGGGSGAAGGGGGAGGGRGAPGGEIEIELQPGTHYIDVGDGGDPDTDGEDTIIWTDPLTGLALDPDTADPDDAVRCVGGGRGGTTSAGFAGGSGGGAGSELPVSGGSSSSGGTGTAGQGNAGGGSNSVGGIATCARAAGGGGGSLDGPGGDGAASFPSEAGEGGAPLFLEDWNVLLGGGGTGGVSNQAGASGGVCGPDFFTPGAAGEGFGAGGGGGSDGGATPGRSGGAWFMYEGPTAPLQVPVISSTEVTEQNQATICIEAADWPPTPDGYRARVEYALGTTEPDPGSSDWRLAGYLDGPGCVTTPPVPTGARVWSRATAEAPGYLDSPSSTASDETTAQTPGLIGLSLEIDDEGVATLRWEANPFTDTLEIRGLVHEEGDDTTPPLALLDTVDSDDGSFVLPDPVPEEWIGTVDITASMGSTTIGRSYRVTTQHVRREIITRSDGIDRLSDVVITSPAEDDLLQLNASGDWVNVPVADALDDYTHHTRHEEGGDDEIKLDDLAEPDDNTDLDADATRHGLLPKLSGDTDQFLRGDGTWAIPPAAGGSWTEIVAAVAEDVVASNVLQNDDELFFATLTGEVYEFELALMYAGTATSTDFSLDLRLPTAHGFFFSIGADSGSGSALGPGNTNFAGATDSGDINLGTRASFAPNVYFGKGMFVSGANADFGLRFACGPAGTGTARRLPGSILRYRKIA